MGEPVRERAVVREQERSGRVDVETADGHDARLVRDEGDDRGPPLGVARGRDDTGRLVQQHVGELLLGDAPAVHLDDVGGGDERVQLPGLPVHGHAAGLDQVVGAAPGGDSGTGEVGVQPHERIVPV